jgi:hypothetical protein
MIDLSKKYTTKDGNEVKLFEIHKDKIIGMVIFEVTSPYPTLWELNGKHISDWKQFDLIEVFEPESVWVNAYQDEYGIHLGVEFETEAEARSQINSSGGYIKTVEINNAK